MDDLDHTIRHTLPIVADVFIDVTAFRAQDNLKPVAPAVLRYPSRKDADDTELRFTRICPASSESLMKQVTPLSPPGLTAVVYISHEDSVPFRRAVKVLERIGYPFRAVEQLHFTLLGLFAGDLLKPLAKEEIYSVISVAEEHMQDFPLRTIHFDLLRPGVWSKHDGCGDGTVVALANERDSTQIIEWSAKLAAGLARRLPNLFPETKKKHALGGVWCNLGYYDSQDFDVDHTVFRVFEELMPFNAMARIDEIAFSEFRLKSLADGIVRGIIRMDRDKRPPQAI
jgi:hypothetical protein